jgi:tRNA uridine 5-carboxymethylaminomethyl modification enzyme
LDEWHWLRRHVASVGLWQQTPLLGETEMTHEFDIVVIGGGHAGAEAAWAASRLGASVALITLDCAKIGQMSCNPAIGGLAKGQMVREIDALGGMMGRAIDSTGIQFRMLNRSKGPAVWGPRAQADKYRYAAEVQQLLATCPGLTILAGEAAEILTDSGGTGSNLTGVLLADGSTVRCRCAIVTTGTFLRGLMHTGETRTEGGRVGESAARGLSSSLSRLGLELGRLKTGTPPRLHRDSIDFAAFEPQPGDAEPAPFSYLNDSCSWRPPLRQVECWIGATNAAIHAIIRQNLHRAPMYSGQIASTGPRYCPSIEDKVVRFADKQQHHIFLEPEGLDTPEIYCNGISTSLPADVQEQMVRLVPGLESAKILRFGYAVEYDMVWPTQIQATLQTKRIAGLFLAGQINGTSGYEEAAAQGLVAGINAARLAVGGQADFVLRRDQAYIGVLIDDLVTKPPTEPYRMFTSRAEHRLHLRSDNADQRLTPIGRDIGLVDDRRWDEFCARQRMLTGAMTLLKSSRMGDQTAFDFLRRPDALWSEVAARISAAAGVAPSIARQVDISAKYEGYIARQDRQIERFSQLESKLIPASLDYATVTGLRNEARQKLGTFTPRSLGQALRISGITPADITVLAIHLQRR